MERRKTIAFIVQRLLGRELGILGGHIIVSHYGF